MNLNDMQKKDSGQVQPKVTIGIDLGKDVTPSHKPRSFDEVRATVEKLDLNARVEALMVRGGWRDTLDDKNGVIRDAYWPDAPQKSRCEKTCIYFRPGHGFPELVKWSVERQAWYADEKASTTGNGARDGSKSERAHAGQPPAGAATAGGQSSGYRKPVCHYCDSTGQIGPSDDKYTCPFCADNPSSPAIPAGLPPIPETHVYFSGNTGDIPGLLICRTDDLKMGWFKPGWTGWRAPYTAAGVSYYAIRPKQNSGAGAAKAETRSKAVPNSERAVASTEPAPDPIPDQTPAESTIAGRFRERTLEMVARELGAWGDQRWIQDNTIEMHIVACQGRVISITEEIEFPANTDDAQTETTRLVALARKFRALVEGMK